MSMRRFFILLAWLPIWCATATADTPFSDLTEGERSSEDILRELIAFETTSERPDEVLRALGAMERRLLEAGFDAADVQVLTPFENAHGLVVRYRGMGQARPLLLLAHIDVVPAVAGDWTFPPFELGTRDGHYLGRGTDDNKAGVVQIVGNLVRLKKESWVPGRDIIGVISGDEETEQKFAQWLASEREFLGEPAFAINSDAGYGARDEQGRPLAFRVQTSEKLYHTFMLTTHNPGGHSSQPREDNAIRDLAQAITRLSDHKFPVRLNDGTRMELRRSAPQYGDETARDMRSLLEDETDPIAAERLTRTDPAMNAILRTTCVPTMLSAGHAENALPRTASVTVNCRILPGTQASEVEQVIAGLVADMDVKIETVYESVPSDVSIIPAEILEELESLVEQYWGEIPLIPSMSTGATDGLFFRNAGIPVFGVSALFSASDGSGAHGLNERIGVRAFHDSMAFWYQMLKIMAE